MMKTSLVVVVFAALAMGCEEEGVHAVGGPDAQPGIGPGQVRADGNGTAGATSTTPASFGGWTGTTGTGGATVATSATASGTGGKLGTGGAVGTGGATATTSTTTVVVKADAGVDTLPPAADVLPPAPDVISTQAWPTVGGADILWTQTSDGKWSVKVPASDVQWKWCNSKGWCIDSTNNPLCAIPAAVGGGINCQWACIPPWDYGAVKCIAPSPDLLQQCQRCPI
jgi:hypothetical protein